MTNRRPTITVVDDDPLVLGVVQALLQQSYSVLTATNGEEALDLLRRHQNGIALFICDVVMPDIDGFQLAEQIMAERPGARVMLMSGYPMEHTSQSVPDVPFLEKPFTKEGLEAAVARILEAAHPHPETRPD